MIKTFLKNKKLIIFIIALALIVAVGLIILFTDNKQKPDNDIENQTEVNEEVKQETNDQQKEELINLDYVELEGTISEASIMYVFDNYSFMENTITEEISLSVLVDNNYIEDETILKLYNDVSVNNNHMPNIEEEVKIVTIDNYVGKNYREVKNYLESLNLYVLVEKENLPVGESANNYDSETIIRQSIPAGNKIYEYSNITLYIPNIITSYPNFCNGTYNVTDIQQFADSNNLVLTIEYVENSGYETGTILYQSRAEGTNVIGGTSLKVQVAQ